MANLVAVDPGDVHCGIALFVRDDRSDYGWRCEKTFELSPEDFLDWLANRFIECPDEWEFLVYEKFRLYEDKAAQQTGSEFPTAKCIGVIEWLGRVHNRHAREHQRADRGRLPITCGLEGSVCAPSRGSAARHPHEIELVKQPAERHTFTDGIVRRLGIKLTAEREGDPLGHRKVAERHGWYFIIRTLDARETSGT